MKLIIAGGRDIKLTVAELRDIIDEKFGSHVKMVTEIVSGGARGVDDTGEKFALYNNFRLKVFPADWAEYGKKAGPIRNAQMADYADSCLLIWDGKSPGSADMKRQMQKRHKIVYEVIRK